MKKIFQLSLCLLSISAFTSCNSNSDESYVCGPGLCELAAGGDYDSAEECQLACGASGGVTDADGNTYGSIIIGTQEWTTSNLNVSHYRNGDPIPEVQDFAAWQDLTTGAWCYYENNTANGPIYGKLYNWYAVTDPRGLAPAGWHVPSDSEMVVFIDLLGGHDSAGGKMKLTGTTYWNAPNEAATNASGFSGLPGGNRDDNLGFINLREGGYWWSSSEYTVPFAYSQYAGYDTRSSSRLYGQKRNGKSVRCVKD